MVYILESHAIFDGPMSKQCAIALFRQLLSKAIAQGNLILHFWEDPDSTCAIAQIEGSHMPTEISGLYRIVQDGYPDALCSIRCHGIVQSVEDFDVEQWIASGSQCQHTCVSVKLPSGKFTECGHKIPLDILDGFPCGATSVLATRMASIKSPQTHRFWHLNKNGEIVEAWIERAGMRRPNSAGPSKCFMLL